jgi:hypothetical protein
MLRIHPFVMGHLIGAVMTGAIAGAFIGPQAAFMGALILLVGAVVSCLICQWWPGVEAPAWKLWLIGVLANPLFLVAVAFSIDQYECLIGQKTGWNCMFFDLGPKVAAMCLLPPIGGLLWRGWRRWRAPAA